MLAEKKQMVIRSSLLNTTSNYAQANQADWCKRAPFVAGKSACLPKPKYRNVRHIQTSSLDTSGYGEKFYIYVPSSAGCFVSQVNSNIDNCSKDIKTHGLNEIDVFLSCRGIVISKSLAFENIQTITKFEPSDNLVSYYIKAVKELSDISKNLSKQELSNKITISTYEYISESDKITKENATLYVQKLVTRLISTIGKGAFEADLDYFHLTDKLGRFSPNVCKVILDRILINEYDIPDFLNQLYDDLVPVAENKVFCRKWGKLIIQNKQLTIELNKHKEESESSWNRAKMF